MTRHCSYTRYTVAYVQLHLFIPIPATLPFLATVINGTLTVISGEYSVRESNPVTFEFRRLNAEIHQTEHGMWRIQMKSNIYIATSYMEGVTVQRVISKLTERNKFTK